MSAGLHTTVLDTEGLLRLFRHLAGRKLIGAVDGLGAVELVFEHRDEEDGNLVTIETEGARRGQVSFGFVSQAFIDSGYGKCDE